MDIRKELKDACYKHIGNIISDIKKENFDVVCASIITDYFTGAKALSDIILSEIKAGKTTKEIETLLL